MAAHDQLWQIFVLLKQALNYGAAAMALDTWPYQQIIKNTLNQAQERYKKKPRLQRTWYCSRLANKGCTAVRRIFFGKYVL